MPSYRDHLLFGAILVLVFSSVAGALFTFTVEAVLVSAALVLLASVAPDIDHEGSVVYRKTRAFTVLLAAAAPLPLFYPDPVPMVLSAAGSGGFVAVAFLWLKPRHRTVTHTIEAAIVFSVTAAAASYVAFDTVLPGVFTLV
ncbi:MAG: metal-dependent hydrolase [Candidatus Nanohaloarchaea archaeon]